MTSVLASEVMMVPVIRSPFFNVTWSAKTTGAKTTTNNTASRILFIDEPPSGDLPQEN